MNELDKAQIEGYSYYVRTLPDKFPYLVVTNPITDLNINTISFLVGTITTGKDKKEIDNSALIFAFLRTYEHQNIPRPSDLLFIIIVVTRLVFVM